MHTCAMTRPRRFEITEMEATGTISETSALRMASSDDGDGDDALLARVGDVTPEVATAALFGGDALTGDQLAAMDQLGNRNGAYDLGDLLSWRARCGRDEVSCGAIVSATDAGSLPASPAMPPTKAKWPNLAPEEGRRPCRAALRPKHGRKCRMRSTAARDALGCGRMRARQAWPGRPPRDRLDPGTGSGSCCQRLGLRHRG